MAILPARLPRFQALPVSECTTANHGLQALVVGGVRLRCWMPDCSSWGGDLGRVIMSTVPVFVPGDNSYDTWEYQARRGFRKLEESLYWLASNTGSAEMKLGKDPRGERRNPGKGDWNTRDPLGSRSERMPGETYGMDDGDSYRVECPECKRVVEFTVEDCRAAIARLHNAVAR